MSRTIDVSGRVTNRPLRLAMLGLMVTCAILAAFLPVARPAHASFSAYTEIVNNGSRGCVDVVTEQGAYNWGTQIENWQCTGADDMQWWEQPLGNGYFQVQNLRSKLCLDASNFWTRQWGCNQSPQQLWHLVWQPGFPNNAYQLQAQNGLCLELTGGNGAQGQLLSDTTCSSWYAQWWELP